jgi:hypothetical protein
MKQSGNDNQPVDRKVNRNRILHIVTAFIANATKSIVPLR